MRRAVLAATLVACAPAVLPSVHHAPIDGLQVRGDHLSTLQGVSVVLRGVNLSGSEFRCTRGDGIFEGPDVATLVTALSSWNVNAVRMPLNESCWLGDGRLSAATSGSAYRNAIVKRVTQLRAHGWYVIVDLHWSAIGSAIATGIAPMPHAERAPLFWSSVATAFQGDRGVLFDLYNEPHITHLQGAEAWRCWRDGCTINGQIVAGMRALVDAVRRSGARNVVLASGLDWANDLSLWASYRPQDDQLAAGFHTYNFNKCNTSACWNLLPSDGPVVITELGENDCASAFARGAIAWARGKGASVFAWTWNRWDCKQGPALIEQWDGTPTPYGHGVRDALRAWK
jgi:hypothetical protein